MDEISLDLPVNPGADLLQRVPLFKTLGYGETMALSEITHLERKPDGELIIQQDSLGQALFILREGTAMVRRRDPITGEQKDLALLQPGELIGEMSLIDDNLASADVVAKGDVELLVIPRQKFDNMLASNDKLAVKIYKCFCRALTDRLRKANKKLADAQKAKG